MRTRHTAVTALALLLAACGSTSGGNGTPAVADGNDAGEAPGTAADSGAKAPVVTGTPDPTQITEDKGIFVAPSGSDSQDGTRPHPYRTLAVAVASAAKVGKIVFACTGTYAEPLVVTDSISIIGGLDCSGSDWTTGAAPSRIESPSSPAISATSITSPTRLESLDVVAPPATAAGASSIGLFAAHSTGLTIATSKITASDGAAGLDGTNGNAPTETGSVRGGDSAGPAPCTSVPGSACVVDPAPAGGAGGHSTCGGSDGGRGGAGGEYSAGGPDANNMNFWVAVTGHIGGGGGGPGTGTIGNDGPSGGPAAELGSLTADGYLPASGNTGSNGGGGAGGRGGVGGTTADLRQAFSTDTGHLSSGEGGPGGGAGGCGGLAGTAGGGGGASIGVALFESPIVLDGVQVTAGNGGSAGHGTLGSAPTAGGDPGTSHVLKSSASPGGRGGYPGIGTNGSNGPSIGVLFTTTAPTVTGTTKATPGNGAPAIDAVTDPTSGRSIPATPAGVSVAMQKG